MGIRLGPWKAGHKNFILFQFITNMSDHIYDGLQFFFGKGKFDHVKNLDINWLYTSINSSSHVFNKKKKQKKEIQNSLNE